MTIQEIMVKARYLPEGNYTLSRPLGRNIRTKLHLRVQLGVEPMLINMDWIIQSDLISNKWTIDGLGDSTITEIPEGWEIA